VSAVPCTVKRNNYQWIQSALSGSLHLSGVNLISHGNNHVLLGAESPGFKNETIPLADLAGSARAYPEADQGYPIGYEQQRELYRELLGMADGKAPNPLVMEMRGNYKNRRLVLRYVGDSDMVLPEQPARDQVLEDITKLVDPKAEPIPGTDPVSGQPVDLPSVMPDPDFLKDFWDVAIGAVVEYGLNNAKMMETNPKQFENDLFLSANAKPPFEVCTSLPSRLITTGGRPRTSFAIVMVCRLRYAYKLFKQAIIGSGCLTRIRDVERIPFSELDISDVRVTHEKWNWKQGNQ
jgi:hypothetical protein